MVLSFLVRNQTISYIDTKVTPRIGSSKYLQLKFNFATKDWSSLRKTLHISAGEYSEPFILESNIFDVPAYYKQQESFKITLLGDNESEGIVVPTNVLTVSLDESNTLWTAQPPDSQNSAYIELLNSIGNLNDLTTEAKNNLVAAINEAAQTCSGSVQPDWNQNDSTAADYVKNRPFYTETRETVLVEESTVPFQNSGSVYMAGLESTFVPTVGETYKVYWDGAVYECICIELEGLKTIGNLSIYNEGPDTGEPFLMDMIDGIAIEIATKDTSASHTLSISGVAEPIVKIPSKYIDKDTSGYIVLHKNPAMTEEDVQNYINAFFEGKVRFITWMGLCITGLDNDNTDEIILTTQNNERYSIVSNNEGLFFYRDREFISARFPTDESFGVYVGEKVTKIFPESYRPGVGTTSTVFEVRPDGRDSKPFDVLGNGEVVAPALILYSSTAGSTKKFRITVDDSGTISATEVM